MPALHVCVQMLRAPQGIVWHFLNTPRQPPDEKVYPCVLNHAKEPVMYIK